MQKILEKLLAWKKSPAYVPFDVASHVRELQVRNAILEEIITYVIKNTGDEKIKKYIQKTI